MADGCRQRHTVERAAEAGLGCIEIAVRVQPDDARAVRLHARQRAQARVAVAGQHHRALPFGYGIAHGQADLAVEIHNGVHPGSAEIALAHVQDRRASIPAGRGLSQRAVGPGPQESRRSASHAGVFQSHMIGHFDYHESRHRSIVAKRDAGW